MIHMTTVFEQIRNGTQTDEQAYEALASALNALDLPTQEWYAPDEVIAIGARLIEQGRKELAARSDMPTEVKPFVEALGPLSEVLREDLEELAKT